jgi:hypothetical protein
MSKPIHRRRTLRATGATVILEIPNTSTLSERARHVMARTQSRERRRTAARGARCRAAPLAPLTRLLEGVRLARQQVRPSCQRRGCPLDAAWAGRVRSSEMDPQIVRRWCTNPVLFWL